VTFLVAWKKSLILVNNELENIILLLPVVNTKDTVFAHQIGVECFLANRFQLVSLYCNHFIHNCVHVETKAGLNQNDIWEERLCLTRVSILCIRELPEIICVQIAFWNNN